jgi:hypothetical protein
MSKPTKSKKYLDGLGDKGLMKTCVIVPIDDVAEIHDLAAKKRAEKLRREGKV